MRRHCGPIDSDKIVNGYLSQLERYVVVVDAPVPWHRRAWRWVVRSICYLTSL